MSFLSGLFDNPAIKKAAFGTIKKQIVENGLELITLFLDDKGEIEIVPYKEKMRLVPEADFGKITPGEKFFILSEDDFNELCRMASAFQQIGKDINDAKSAVVESEKEVTND